jgi:hypothetical protein
MRFQIIENFCTQNCKVIKVIDVSSIEEAQKVLSDFVSKVNCFARTEDDVRDFSLKPIKEVYQGSARTIIRRQKN